MADLEDDTTEDEQIDDSSSEDSTEQDPGGDDAPKGKTFTQEDVDRIAAEAREKGRKSALRKQQNDSPQKKKSTPKSSNDEIETLRAEMRWRDVADEHGLTPKQRNRLFDMYRREEPEDVGEWLGELRTDGLLPSAKEPATDPTTPEEPKDEGKRRMPKPPRKVRELERDGLVDVFTLDEQQLDEMGMEKVVEHYERAKAAGYARMGAPRVPEVLSRKR